MNKNRDPDMRVASERLAMASRRLLPGLSAISLIVALVATIGVLFQMRESTQLVRELLASPDLEGQAILVSRTSDELERVQSEMIDDLFDAVLQRAEEDPDATYSEIASEVLPITRSVQPGPVEIIVRLENRGVTSASDVSVSIGWVGKIMEVDAHSISNWAIIDGGINDDRVVVSIEQIPPRELAEVFVTFSPSEGTTDDVTLGAFSSLTSPSTSYYYQGLPLVFNLDPGVSDSSYELIDVRIGSQETAIELLDVADSSESPLTVCDGQLLLPRLKPPEATYQVQYGDTLVGIAEYSDVTVRQLIQANDTYYPILAQNPDCILQGWWLLIP